MDSVILVFLNQWVAWDKAEIAPSAGNPSGFLVDGDFMSRLEGARMLRTCLDRMIRFEEKEETKARLPAG